MKPKDAATLMLIDRSRAQPHVLMGRRSSKHVFMPNVYVFPGGKKDRDDWRVQTQSQLDENVVQALMTNTHSRFSKATAHSLAVAAARELHEETSVHLSRCGDKYELSPLRFFARAITPMGQSRRYDTRFFSCFCDDVGLDAAAAQDSNELLDLRWVNIFNLPDIPVAPITNRVLTNLKKTLESDVRLTQQREPEIIKNR